MALFSGTGQRPRNEARVLAAIRRHKALSRADLVRLLGLSAPAVSEIVDALHDRGLLRPEAKRRGLIGQPQTPFALDPAGGHAFGIKIGRRNVESVAVDLIGRVTASMVERHAVPEPDAALRTARRLIEDLRAATGSPDHRLLGVGVCMPWDFHDWAEALGLPTGSLDGWRGLDVLAALGLTGPGAAQSKAVLINDASAAMAAHLAHADPPLKGTALGLYLGTFVGGGLAIDGRLHLGDRGNAAAIASLPVCARGADGRSRQLLDETSLVPLEHALAGLGLDPVAVLLGDVDDPRAERLFAEWCGAVAGPLARSIVVMTACLDVSLVIIDGILKPAWRQRVVEATLDALMHEPVRGIRMPVVREGQVGWSARVLGAALTVLEDAFLLPLSDDRS